MRNATSRYSVVSLSNANITSIDYGNKTLLIGVRGNNGNITVSDGTLSHTFPVNGFQVIELGNTTTTVTNTVTLTVTSTITTTVTTTVTNSTTITVTENRTGPSDWTLPLLVGAIIGAGIAVGYFAISKKKRS